MGLGAVTLMISHSPSEGQLLHRLLQARGEGGVGDRW